MRTSLQVKANKDLFRYKCDNIYLYIYIYEDGEVSLFLGCGIEHGDRRLLSKRQLESTAPVQVPPPKRTATSTWSTPTPREAPPKVAVKCLGAVDRAFKENPRQFG